MVWSPCVSQSLVLFHLDNVNASLDTKVFEKPYATRHLLTTGKQLLTDEVHIPSR